MAKAVQRTDLGLAEAVQNEMNRLIESAPRDVEGQGAVAILSQIFGAHDVASFQALGGKLDNGKDLANKPIVVYGIMARDTDLEDSPLPIYLTVEYERAHGAGGREYFNTGSVVVVATLLRLHDLDLFPVACHIEAKELKSGNVALNLIID